MTNKINKLCIIGTGLIGGSFALALKKAEACQQIIGCGRSEATLKKAQQLNIIDSYQMDIVQAVKQVDVIFISVPLGAYPAVFEAIAKGLAETNNKQLVISDAGSSKVKVQQLAEKLLNKNACRFVAGHPIAGTENSGPAAAFAELFNQQRVILTPTNSTDADATATIKQLWQLTGAKVEYMDAKCHDKILAATSHLPHLLAFSLVNNLKQRQDHDQLFNYIGGGFKDFTRIASSDPTMWRDICLHNKQPIADALKSYILALENVSQALANNEGDALFSIFQQAKTARDDFCKK